VKFIFGRELLDIRNIANSSPVVQSRVRVIDTGGARDFQSMPTYNVVEQEFQR
jgi:hypothetical protein